MKHSKENSGNYSSYLVSLAASIMLVVGLTALSNTAFGITTTIEGKAPGYKRETIFLFVLEDPFSNRRKLITSCELKESGTFSLTLDLEETQRVFLSIRNAEGELYLRPGEKIHIVFPEIPHDRPVLFDATPVSILFPDTAEGRLNIAIRAYNSAHAKFIDDHFYDFAVNQYSGSAAYKMKIAREHPEIDLVKMSSVDTSQVKADPRAFLTALQNWESDLQKRFAFYFTDPFFENYVRYSFSELEMLSGISKKELYRKYLMSQPVLHRLPPYLTLFDALFGDCISDAPKSREAEFIRIINSRQTAADLKKCIRGDSLLTHEELIDMAALRGLQKVWNDRRFQQVGIIALIGDLKNTASLIRNWIDPVQESLLTGTAGWKLPNVILLNASDDRISLETFRGKYVYLIFFAKWCSSCVREMQMLEQIAGKYNDEILMVAVNMDDDYDQFRKYLSLHKKQDFIFLSGKGDPLLKQKFNLKSIPTCFLFNPEGKLMNAYTKKPSEGIQKEFEKIKFGKKSDQMDFNNWKKP